MTSDARHTHDAATPARKQSFYVNCHPHVTNDAAQQQMHISSMRAADNVVIPFSPHLMLHCA
jgi:hypothetical protein